VRDPDPDTPVDDVPVEDAPNEDDAVGTEDWLPVAPCDCDPDGLDPVLRLPDDDPDALLEAGADVLALAVTLVEDEDAPDPDSEAVADPDVDGGGVAVELTLLLLLTEVDPELLLLLLLLGETELDGERAEQYRRTRFSKNETTKRELVVWVSKTIPAGWLKLV